MQHRQGADSASIDTRRLKAGRRRRPRKTVKLASSCHHYCWRANSSLPRSPPCSIAARISAICDKLFVADHPTTECSANRHPDGNSCGRQAPPEPQEEEKPVTDMPFRRDEEEPTAAAPQQIEEAKPVEAPPAEKTSLPEPQATKPVSKESVAAQGCTSGPFYIGWRLLRTAPSTCSWKGPKAGFGSGAYLAWASADRRPQGLDKSAHHLPTQSRRMWQGDASRRGDGIVGADWARSTSEDVG